MLKKAFILEALMLETEAIFINMKCCATILALGRTSHGIITEGGKLLKLIIKDTFFEKKAISISSAYRAAAQWARNLLCGFTPTHTWPASLIGSA